MLDRVDVGERSFDAYRGIAPDAILEEARDLAAGLRRVRVLHVNATPYGGGVSELLRSVVPLLNDLGLIAEWKIIQGDDAFFQVTKRIHNALQGATGPLTEAELATFRQNAEENAARLDEEYDFVFVHDPQPAAILAFRGKGTSRWVWRCHIDTSEPDPEVWDLLKGYLIGYDAAVFTMPQFVPREFPISRVEIIPPAIDPLSPKNFEIPESTVRAVLEWIGVRTTRPLITQVSRFDPWKDPLGVIAAYRLAREQIPNLQLALVGSMALDDPEGWEVYRAIRTEASSDPLIHVFTNLTGVGNIEVNAFQSLSDIVIQKSLREGFGLVVSEALWKRTPVIAGRAGGIPLQMADDVGGLLVDTVEECAEAIVELLEDPARADVLARSGQQRIREHFLLPRLLLNELSLMTELMKARPLRPRPVWEALRDPVCGMAITLSNQVPPVVFERREYRFCSRACRSQFAESPWRYAAT